MRILVVNPVGHPRWDEQDRRLYESFASPGTEVDVVSLPSGPPSVETPEAHAEVVPLVVRRVLENLGGYDGFVVNCFLDPGVDLLKGIIAKPVVGPCEASMAVASAVGGKVGVVTVGGDAAWMVEERIRSLGYADRLAALEAVRLGVLELDRDPDATLRELIGASRAAAARGAEVLVLGCTGLAGLAKRVEEEVGVPVVDPAGAALKLVEALVALGLRNPRAGRRSRKSF